MDILTVVLGVLAGLVQLAGYWQYNKKLAYKDISPNATSWALWGGGGVIEYALYGDLAQDWVKEFLPMMCAVAVFATFVHMLFRVSCRRPDGGDVVLFSLDIGVVVFWILTQDPLMSNVLLGADIIISHFPIFRSTWKEPCSENETPWMTWTIAYTLLTLVVCMRWEKWGDLIYPLAGLVSTAMVWAMVRWRHRIPVVARFSWW